MIIYFAFHNFSKSYDLIKTQVEPSDLILQAYTGIKVEKADEELLSKSKLVAKDQSDQQICLDQSQEWSNYSFIKENSLIIVDSGIRDSELDIVPVMDEIDETKIDKVSL